MTSAFPPGLLSDESLGRLTCQRTPCVRGCPSDPHLQRGVIELCNGLRHGAARHYRESEALGLREQPALIFHLLPSFSCLPRHHCHSLGLMGNRIGYYVLARAAAATAGLPFVDVRPTCKRAAHAVSLLPRVAPAPAGARVSRSVYEAVSRLNNLCGVSRSQRASNLNLCESRFGWLNIRFSELILCILFKVGWYKVTSPAHERGVRATRRHREGRFPQGPHGAVKSCGGAFHRTWNGPNSACR